jgi:hypothetical protein
VATEMSVVDFILFPLKLQRRSIRVEGDTARFHLNGLWQVCSAIIYLAAPGKTASRFVVHTGFRPNATQRMA